MPDFVRDAANAHRPRHAAPHQPKPPRVMRTSPRRIALATAIAAALGLLTTASGASTPPSTRRNSDVSGTTGILQASRLDLKVPTLADLSQGAPAGAKLLPFAPITLDRPAPATPAIISGLAANGIPQVALNAYRVAAARMATIDPGCGIDWSLLAGIGRIESNHGQYGGATLAPNGDSTPRIVGEVLDGSKWDYIADTDGGRYDGDTRFDHAVGPMQFIPSTWAIYGTDANGDGVADPFNVNDAALAAARYLCTAGGDLRSADGQTRAVLAYNHNNEYLAMVLAMAAAYANGIPVGGPIYGITTGQLPPVDTTWIPPVNPAAPTALGSAETTASHDPGAAPATATSKPKPGTGQHGGARQPGAGSGRGTGSGSGSGPTPARTTPAPGVPAQAPAPAPAVPAPPVQLPISLPPLPSQLQPPVEGVVGAVTSTVCTTTGLLGLPVQIPCP